MIRDVANDRPFIRVRPNGPYLLNQAFADRVNDSRWDNTFQEAWTPPFEVNPARRAAFKGIIVTPSGAPKNDPTSKSSWDPAIFSSMKKYDNATRANLNDASTRPFVM